MVMASLFKHYTAVCQKLGLAFEDGRIHGAVDGIPVQMWFGAHSVHTMAMLTRPAPIGLGVATKGLVAKVADMFGSHSGAIGDAAFDAVFRVKAPDVARVAALLSPAARAAHLRRFSQSAIADDEQTIERDFREAARLARVLGDSFA